MHSSTSTSERLRLAAFALAGAAGLLLAAELVLRFLPVSTSTETAYRIDPLILTVPPGHTWRVATGWDLRRPQTLHANAWGFAADREFTRDANAVALIGDSYVEASALPAHDRPAAQLERALGGRPVYALACPGTSLLDHAERIRFARDHFGVRDVVVFMDRNDVRQALCGSGNNHGPCLDAATRTLRTVTVPEAGPAKRLLRHSALAQYVVSQLKLDPGSLWQQALAQARPAAPEPPASPASSAPSAPKRPPLPVAEIAAAFFHRAPVRPGERMVLVVDADRAALARGDTPTDPDREPFFALARAAGATVIDTTPLYTAALAERPHLLLQIAPTDGHLDARGAGIVATAAAQALRGP